MEIPGGIKPNPTPVSVSVYRLFPDKIPEGQTWSPQQTLCQDFKATMVNYPMRVFINNYKKRKPSEETEHGHSASIGDMNYKHPTYVRWLKPTTPEQGSIGFQQPAFRQRRPRKIPPGKRQKKKST
jgi:hypothetical protein